MTWLAALKLILQLAAYFARRAERIDIEKAVLNELENLHHKRVDAAVAASDDVRAGRVPVDPNDPYRRD
ncbi:hypothetical protein PMI07_002355 [Rhizobium sp. CF080]|uniref:hypothetical protein n=1 Tax=Rhizobium sp. (strain CF080) TaxID=1144310 RepID=UPI0002717815|nr:hypothetical protein [Rhizobium sp. CF080]EUB95867.1 hypothetical protein PMI07_002355 [Rhizobium sp. CF080]